MWADGDFCSLSRPQPNAQSVWQWLLTGPNTVAIPGVVIAKPEAIAVYYGWYDDPSECSSDDVEKISSTFGRTFAATFWRTFSALLELTDRGMAKVDCMAGLIFLPKAIRAGRECNRPRNPNAVRTWSRAWPEVPECGLKDEIWQALRSYMEWCDNVARKKPSTFVETFESTFPRTLRSTLLRQEQESGTGRNTHARSRKSAQAVAAKDYSDDAYRIADYLKAKIVKQQPGHVLRLATHWTEALRQRWAMHADRMTRIDQRPVAKTKTLIDWVFGDQGGREARFVVESTESLRKKWDKLMRASNEAKSHKAKSEPYAPERTIINPRGES